MSITPIEKLSLAVHHQTPGTYALLLGSGISKSAQIPTGWDIVLDLIKKVAALKKEDTGDDPEKWFKDKFGKAPEYSKLLDVLTKTQEERKNLLKPYFEPTEEEREEGKKQPTEAHKAIARLIKLGYFRMIITTNFDRLLDQALKDEGITPDVVMYDDQIEGTVPYVHSQCFILKVNGDYLDTRIKNTEQELSKYSSKLNKLLSQIFDDFGLIICGWSGEWDNALRDAIMKSPFRRYSLFWLKKGDIVQEAQDLIDNKKAEVIEIENADSFISELEEKLTSLKELDKPHPLTAEIAVETVKRYLSEEKYDIKLHDLINNEISGVKNKLDNEIFNLKGKQIDKEYFQKIMYQCESCVENLMLMMMTIAYYDKDKNSYLIKECIEKLMSFEHQGMDLRYYPALLVFYSSGISAFIAKKFENLFKILCEPLYYDFSKMKKMPCIFRLNSWYVFGDNVSIIPIERAEKKYSPLSNYLLSIMNHKFIKIEYISSTDFKEKYLIIEYFYTLIYMDILNKDFGPIGLYISEFADKLHFGETSILDEFLQNYLENENSELLLSGFFNKSIERVKNINEKLKALLRKESLKVI
ncbi:SIR2 family protein [candidate division KSB1 bacterium]